MVKPKKKYPISRQVSRQEKRIAKTIARYAVTGFAPIKTWQQTHVERSKYMPHQGTQEAMRRYLRRHPGSFLGSLTRRARERALNSDEDILIGDPALMTEHGLSQLGRALTPEEQERRAQYIAMLPEGETLG